jgi:hypothetical protein
MSARVKRREFIALLGGVTAGWGLPANAQQPSERMRHIGVLMTQLRHGRPAFALMHNTPLT